MMCPQFQEQQSPSQPTIKTEPAGQDLAELEIYESYRKSPYLSFKYSAYFHVYTELLERYRHKSVTFVEIGVLNGGSLFMWREYLGPKARIIGIDFNPAAKKWEQHGFEIFIGSQSDPKFWETFFKAAGPVDVVLDDGGHTFEQQIVTVHNCVPNVKEGGLIIIEDTHTSYYEEFGYPTRYTFIEWTKLLIDNINSRFLRFPDVRAAKLPYRNSIYSITVFESIVCFKIQPSRCRQNHPTSNGGISSAAEDFRHEGSSLGSLQTALRRVADRLPLLRRLTILKVLKTRIVSVYAALITRRNLRRLGEFF